MLSFFCRAESAPWVGDTLDNFACSGGGQGYGPFDYTKRASLDKYNLSIVERKHFTANVEMLVKGESGRLIEDLDYTLRAWPNHPRALNSIMRYQFDLDNNPNNKKPNLTSPVECYFQRAINFSRKDTTAMRMYGYFLKKSGHLNRAKFVYKMGLSIAPENRALAYSYSFLLIDLKEYEEALKYAHLVYSNGAAPNQLKDKLKRLDKWRDVKKQEN